MQSLFQIMEMVSIEVLRGEVPHVLPTLRPTRVDAPGVRSTCIWAPCQDPDYEIALVSKNTYASNTEMTAAYVEGDKSIMATIQKVRQAGMGEDLTPEDYEEARSYGESVGFGGHPPYWRKQA